MRSGKCLLMLGLVCFIVVSAVCGPGLISPYLGDRAHAQIAESLVTDESMPVVVYDPNEKFNRAMFGFNDKLYFYVMKPVSTVYAAYLPPGVRVCIRNTFYNFYFPIRFINSLLQGKAEKSGVETVRFVINSTLGLGGLFDYADYGFCIRKPPEEDFGQTLAVWGTGTGPYLVLPVLGPTNHRDFAGFAVDNVMDPTFWVPADWWLGLVVRAGRMTNNTSLRLGEYEEFKKGALDPYVSMRTAYQQYRQREIAR